MDASPNTGLVSIDESKLSEQEKFVRSVLKDYSFEKKTFNSDWTTNIEYIKADPAEILKQIFDDANSAISQNASGDIIPDHKTRATLKLKLLEAMGVVKPKQLEVKVNFFSLLFWDKR